MKNRKNIILILSIIGVCVLVFLRYSGILDFLYENHRSSFATRNFEILHNTFLFFPFIFIFSLITYKLPQSVFAAWWKFARMAIPVIFILSIMINMGVLHSNGGFFNMDNNFDLAALILLYSIFTIGSIIQIVRGYRHR